MQLILHWGLKSSCLGDGNSESSLEDGSISIDVIGYQNMLLSTMTRRNTVSLSTDVIGIAIAMLQKDPH